MHPQVIKYEGVDIKGDRSLQCVYQPLPMVFIVRNDDESTDKWKDQGHSFGSQPEPRSQVTEFSKEYNRVLTLEYTHANTSPGLAYGKKHQKSALKALFTVRL